MVDSQRGVRLVSILLVISAAAFAVGVGLERSRHHESSSESRAAHAAEAGSETVSGAGTTAAPAGEPGPAAGETGEGAPATDTGEAAPLTDTGEAAPLTDTGGGSAIAPPEGTTAAAAAPTAIPSAETGEKLLGISTESTGLVVLAVAVSILLAVLLWLRGGAPVLLAGAVAAGLAFAAFDVREAVHQSDVSDRALLAIAVAVAALHLAVALAAARVLAGRRGGDEAAV